MNRPLTTRPGQTPSRAGRLVPPSDHEAITKAARGVADRTASTVAFDAGSRTFTITSVNGAWSYYIAGRRYIKTAAESIVIADTSGVHWIYYDGATLTEIIDPDHDETRDLIVNKVRVGLIYWNATDGVEHIAGDERHGAEWPGASQVWAHELFGMVWHVGLDISGYTLDTDSDAGVSFELSDGVVHDEDLEHDIVDGAVATHYAQQLNGGNAEVPIFYRDGVDGSWTADAATDLPWKLIGAGQRLAYNNHVGGGVYGQTEIAANKFVNAFLYVTNGWKYPVMVIQGQNEHASKAAAVQAVDDEVVALGDLPSAEMVLLYGFSLQTNDPFGGTNNCKIVAVTDFRQRSRSGGLAAPPAPHPILSTTHPDTVAAAVTDGALMYGNATPAWAKHPLVTLNTAGVMSGITQLNVDNLRLDGNTISATAGTSIIVTPPSGTGMRCDVTGPATGDIGAWNIYNYGWNAAMTDTRTSLIFVQALSAGGPGVGAIDISARITIGTEDDWGADPRNAYMAFFTALNGDAAAGEKMRITSDGRVGINTKNPTGLGSVYIRLGAHQDGNYMNFAMSVASNNAAHRPTMYFTRSRGIEAARTTVVNGDTIGMVLASPYDGAAFKFPALMKFVVDGAVVLGTVPVAIIFETGAPARSERFRIQSDGDILIDSGTSVFVRDPQLGFNSSVDGQFDIFADVECEITAPTIELIAATVFIRNMNGINYGTGAIADMDLITVSVPGAPRQWWDESEDAFVMTHRLDLTAGGVQTMYATDDVSDPPTDAELDTAFGDPEDLGPGFVGILDDNGAGLYTYICWTTGTNGEWFYVAGTKAV